jgi:hypothetical protein
MHGFNHVPTNDVELMFVKVVQYFKKIAELLTTFKVCH